MAKKSILICKHCKHREPVNLDLGKKFLKGAGVALSAAGPLAWVTYFFAGTGFAAPLCIAMLTVGVVSAAFADEIVKVASKYLTCEKCKHKDWKLIDIDRD